LFGLGTVAFNVICVLGLVLPWDTATSKSSGDYSEYEERRDYSEYKASASKYWRILKEIIDFFD